MPKKLTAQLETLPAGGGRFGECGRLGRNGNPAFIPGLLYQYGAIPARLNRSLLSYWSRRTYDDYSAAIV